MQLILDILKEGFSLQIIPRDTQVYISLSATVPAGVIMVEAWTYPNYLDQELIIQRSKLRHAINPQWSAGQRQDTSCH